MNEQRQLHGKIIRANSQEGFPWVSCHILQRRRPLPPIMPRNRATTELALINMHFDCVLSLNLGILHLHVLLEPLTIPPKRYLLI